MLELKEDDRCCVCGAAGCYGTVEIFRFELSGSSQRKCYCYRHYPEGECVKRERLVNELMVRFGSNWW